MAAHAGETARRHQGDTALPPTHDTSGRLPEGFLVGGALCAHQVEGGDFHSDWWRWEQRPSRIADGATSEVAADHWNRHREDTALSAKLGMNALCLGLSWARTQPEPGAVDTAALDHYRAVLDGALKHAMTPVVVLQEFAAPHWFTAGGGWSNPRAPGQFRAYAEAVAGALADRCRWWVPIAAPEYWLTRAHVERAWPGGDSGGRACAAAREHLAAAHREAVSALRAARPDLLAGASVRAYDVEPRDPDSPWDWQAAERLRRRLNHAFLDRLRGGAEKPFDFILLEWGGAVQAAFSPFRRHFSWARITGDAGLDGAAGNAGGFDTALLSFHPHGVPLLVSVSCNSSETDGERCRFLRDHLEKVIGRATGESPMALAGFFYRPLLDGFEWEHGYTRKRGLLHVNPDGLARTPNGSAYLLGDVAEHGRLRAGTVRRFCGPEA